MQELLQGLDMGQLQIIISLIAFNWILSIAVSLYHKEFRIRKIADFMVSRIFPYVGIWAAASLLLKSVGSVEGYDLSSMSTVMFGVICVALVGHIAAAIKSMGINIPDSISEK